MTNKIRVFQNVSGFGRHVNHDPRSKQFAFDGRTVQLQNVKHKRYIPVLDQGQLGSCTGNAGTGALGTSGVWETINHQLLSVTDAVLDEKFAVQLYSDATQIDDYTAGNYPPQDTGSDGLSIAKVLKSRGLISGYQHTFTLNDALAALVTRPVIIGVNWYDSMMSTDSRGFLNIAANSTLAGGHEVVLDEINVDQQYVGGTNSWSESWGIGGRFFLSFATLERLLKEDGDCTVFVPVNQPAPTPAPVPPAPGPVNPIAPVEFPWADVNPWIDSPHVWSRATKAANAMKKWRSAQGKSA